MRVPAARWHDEVVGMRCVIVDDDAGFVAVAGAILEREGMLVAGVAANGAEAVARARTLRPDVILIDIRLGAESGFDVARRLADSARPAALIMISTHARADYADMLAESPVAGFVPKAELSAAAIRGVLNGG
jgi:DNA-binding NarL/FixJ family response regulator